MLVRWLESDTRGYVDCLPTTVHLVTDGTTATYRQGVVSRPEKFKSGSVSGMTVTEQSTVSALRRQLREDCGVLTHSAIVEIERDDGTVITRRTPCLINQLASAITRDRETSFENVRRSKGAALPAIISVQAFDIMADIDRVSRKWNRDQCMPARVHRAVMEACNRSTLPEMRPMARYLDTWVRLINELFEPLKRISLRGSCPACTESTVRVWNMDYREYYQVAALQLTSHGHGYTAECIACGTEWTSSHFDLLARMLG